MVSTAAFHARVRGSVPGLGGFKETKMFLPHPRVKVSIVGSLRDREVACSASDRQGSNFESCVWRTVSSHSSHHPQEVLLAQFSLYVHKGGLKPDSFHFIYLPIPSRSRICVNFRPTPFGNFSSSGGQMKKTMIPQQIKLFTSVIHNFCLIIMGEFISDIILMIQGNFQCQKDKFEGQTCQ